MDTYKKRLQSFGFNAIVVDGHDVEELCKAFYEAENTKVQSFFYLHLVLIVKNKDTTKH